MVARTHLGALLATRFLGLELRPEAPFVQSSAIRSAWGSSLDLNHDVGDRVLHLRVVGHRARMSATEFFFLTLSIARSHARLGEADLATRDGRLEKGE